jgi:hypothetical protein
MQPIVCRTSDHLLFLYQTLLQIQREIYYDKQFDASLEKLGAGAAPEGGAETSGAAGAGLETAPAPTPEAAEGGVGEEEGPKAVTELPPAKRNDGKPDMRSSMSKKTASYMRSEANPEGASRTTFRTMIPGYDKLSGLYEETNYLEQKEDLNEKRLHEVNQEIKNLLTTLENKDAKIKKTKI